MTKLDEHEHSVPQERHTLAGAANGAAFALYEDLFNEALRNMQRQGVDPRTKHKFTLTFTLSREEENMIMETVEGQYSGFRLAPRKGNVYLQREDNGQYSLWDRAEQPEIPAKVLLEEIAKAGTEPAGATIEGKEPPCPVDYEKCPTPGCVLRVEHDGEHDIKTPLTIEEAHGDAAKLATIEEFTQDPAMKEVTEQGPVIEHARRGRGRPRKHV